MNYYKHFLLRAVVGAAITMPTLNAEIVDPSVPETAIAASASDQRPVVDLLVDNQYCFANVPVRDADGTIVASQGSLALSKADDKHIERVKAYVRWSCAQHNKRIWTTDAHTPKSKTFALNHEGAAPFDMVTYHNGLRMTTQRVYPRHGVKGDAEQKIFAEVFPEDVVIEKGTNDDAESYSGFVDTCETFTPMKDILFALQPRTLRVSGLATDICAFANAEHALALRGPAPTLKADGEHSVPVLVPEGVNPLDYNVEFVLNTSQAFNEADSFAKLRQLQESGARLVYAIGLGVDTKEEEDAEIAMFESKGLKVSRLNTCVPQPSAAVVVAAQRAAQGA